MPDAELEFTNVTSLRAEAQGDPGERTFHVLVDSDADSAVLWLEKEQLFQLALAALQLLTTLPEVQGESNDDTRERAGPLSTHLDFKVGKMVLGHDGGNGMFFIDAHDVESDEDAPATVRVWGDRSHIGYFAEEALRVCAAGRPLCPLCGGPVDEAGHQCPRSNGHGLIEMEDL